MTTTQIKLVVQKNKRHNYKKSQRNTIGIKVKTRYSCPLAQVIRIMTTMKMNSIHIEKPQKFIKENIDMNTDIPELGLWMTNRRVAMMVAGTLPRENISITMIIPLTNKRKSDQDMLHFLEPH